MHRASTCLLLLAVAGCSAAPAASPEPEPHGPLYSPWVLEVERASFDAISFKDVGLSTEPDHREEIYGTIALSLARDLEMDSSLAMTSRVRYSEAASDPDNHLYCAPRHIYVDLWEGTSPERWGYSLWSGCTEEQQFAWREVEREDASVAGLTRYIATSIRDAVRTGCFTRSC